MKNTVKQVRWVLLTNFLLLCVCANAQASVQQEGSATPSATAAHDKSGTNPLLLRYTVQIFNEYYNLPGEGFYNNITRFRFIVPFARQRASFKVDLPFNAMNSSIGFLSGGTERPFGRPPIGVVPGDTKFGFGDLNLKLTYVPYFNRNLKLGLVTSGEFNFDTASKPLLLNYETGKVGSAVETTFEFEQQGITYYATPGFPIGGNWPYDLTTSRSKRALRRFGEGARVTLPDRAL